MSRCFECFATSNSIWYKFTWNPDLCRSIIKWEFWNSCQVRNNESIYYIAQCFHSRPYRARGSRWIRDTAQLLLACDLQTMKAIFCQESKTSDLLRSYSVILFAREVYRAQHTTFHKMYLLVSQMKVYFHTVVFITQCTTRISRTKINFKIEIKFSTQTAR